MRPFIFEALEKMTSTKVFALSELDGENVDILAKEAVEKLSEANVFMFESVPSPSETVEEFPTLDLPFPVCAFQVIGSPILKSQSHSCGVTFQIKAFVAIEETPEKHLFYCVGSRPDEAETVLNSRRIEKKGDRDTFMTTLAKQFLTAMKKRHLATEKINERIKVKTRTGTEFIKIKRLIHVRNRKDETAKGIYGGGGFLDWTHRWEVSGHWRKLQGIGKNRAGEHVVEGFTWVIPHSKGPEGKPLVKKIRTFSDPSPSSTETSKLETEN